MQVFLIRQTGRVVYGYVCGVKSARFSVRSRGPIQKAVPLDDATQYRLQETQETTINTVQHYYLA